MRTKIFSIFITLLGLFTAYAFYMFWHADNINFSESIQEVKKESSDKIITPKKENFQSDSKTLVNPKKESNDKIISEEIKIVKELQSLTIDKIEAQTDAVYDALASDDFEETMVEAEEAFAVLDQKLEAQELAYSHEEEVRLLQESMNVSENVEQEDTEKDEIEIEISGEELLESEDNTDSAQEDVNNL